jgi:hypothetical protein
MAATMGWDVPGLHAALVGDVIAHGAALDEVAVVEEQGVGRLGAGGGDQGRGLGQPDRVVLLVAVIVVSQHVHVQVRGLHQPQPQARRALRREGLAEPGEGAEGDAGLQGGAAGDRGQGHGILQVLEPAQYRTLTKRAAANHNDRTENRLRHPCDIPMNPRHRDHSPLTPMP